MLKEVVFHRNLPKPRWFSRACRTKIRAIIGATYRASIGMARTGVSGSPVANLAAFHRRVRRGKGVRWTMTMTTRRKTATIAQVQRVPIIILSGSEHASLSLSLNSISSSYSLMSEIMSSSNRINLSIKKTKTASTVVIAKKTSSFPTINRSLKKCQSRHPPPNSR